MKALVVFYSRTGVTRKVALALASSLGADVEEIRPLKPRAGATGFVAGVVEAIARRAARIEPIERNVGEYDLVVVGGPVWANTVAGPVREFLTLHGRAIRRGGFFVTTRSSGIEDVPAQMHALAGCQLAALAGFYQKHVQADEHSQALEEFASALRRSLPASG